MKKILAVSSAVLVAGMVSQSEAAQNERWPRWYVGLSGAVSFLDDADISGASTGKFEYNTGGMATLSLGYAPPSSMQPFSNMRFEAELGYHYHGLDSIQLGAAAPTAAGGAMETISYMGNLYYDFRNTGAFTPYIGAGLGGARVKLARASGLGNVDNTDNVFAYQFMGGVSYEPASMPMTVWSLGYRYFVVDEPEFAVAGGGVKLEDTASHNIELGARFRF